MQLFVLRYPSAPAAPAATTCTCMAAGRCSDAAAVFSLICADMACPGGSCMYLHGSGCSDDVLNSYRHRSLSNLTSATINSLNGSPVYLVSAAGCWIRRDQEDSIDASRFLRHT